MRVEIDGVLYVSKLNDMQLTLAGKVYTLVPQESPSEVPVGLPDRLIDNDGDSWLKYDSQDLYYCNTNPVLTTVVTLLFTGASALSASTGTGTAVVSHLLHLLEDTVIALALAALPVAAIMLVCNVGRGAVRRIVRSTTETRRTAVDDEECLNLLILLGELTEHDRNFVLGYMAGKSPELAVEAVAALMRPGTSEG